MVVSSIREQARRLAVANRRAEPGIVRVYWFPHEREVRLVEVERNSPRTGLGRVEPYYFRPRPERGLMARMAVELIHPEEDGKVPLPDGWGDWEDAELLKADE